MRLGPLKVDGLQVRVRVRGWSMYLGTLKVDGLQVAHLAAAAAGAGEG